MLVQSEVLEDYSMGYIDQIGYRASTSIPFYYYDLINEVQEIVEKNEAITEFALRKLSVKNACQTSPSLSCCCIVTSNGAIKPILFI